MIGWKLETHFDEQTHLFFEKIKTNYLIEAYICSCGCTEFIIKNPGQKLKYKCTECENIKFHDANNAWRNIVHFLYQNLDINFLYEYDLQNNEEVVSSCYSINIPKSIDFSSNKVIYGKKPVYTLSLSRNGDLKENYSLRFEQGILEQLKINLTQYINEHNNFNIPKDKTKKLTLNMATFFLKNFNLKEFDFYYWVDASQFQNKDFYISDALIEIANNTKAKSIKKAVYQNYTEQMNNYNQFDSLFIEVFCKSIKDINILTKFLTLKLEYSRHSNIEKENLYQIILFLKKYYSEVQLLKLFSSKEFKSNKYLFRDAVSEFIHNIDVVTKNYKKVPCRVESIHDEFVRCSREERYAYMKSQKLAYTKSVMSSCIETNGYEVKVPKSGEELFNWAEKLHNCMSGYFDMIKNKETMIYGFFKDNILKFAVEISDNEVVQASRKYNEDLTTQEKQVLVKWFNIFFSQELKSLIEVV